MEQQSSSRQFLIDLISGGISTAVSKTISAPIERVRILLQTQFINPKLSSKQYQGIFDCFKRVAVEEGLISFWRGNLANVVRYFPTKAITFSTKDALSILFIKGVDPKQQPGKFFIVNMINGGIAGCVGLIFVYPLDLTRTRLATDIGRNKGERQFKGHLNCMTQILKTDGFTGLYKGFGVSIAGIFLYRAIYFGGYDIGRNFLFGGGKAKSTTNFISMIFFVQFVACMTYPLDTIRRRLMMQVAREKIDKNYKGTIDCIVKILINEGPTGYFRGFLVSFYSSIGSSLALVLYDQFKQQGSNDL